MAAQWTPRFEELKNRVEAALRSDDHDSVQAVGRELEMHRDSIYALFDTARPNEAHRASLKLGRVEIDGKTRTVNDEFISMTIVLSDQLEMDEYAAASLLQHGIQNQARFDRSAVDTAIILFHRERLHLLSCIYALIDTSIGLGPSSKFGRIVELFRKDLLDASKGNLAAKALAQIEVLDKKTSTLKSAVSETSALVAQLGMAINKDRLEYIKQERVLLATILFGIAFYHELTSPVLKSTISALKKMNLSDPISIYLTVTVLAALEVSEEHMLIRGKARDEFPTYMAQEAFIQEYAKMISEHNWAVPAIRATVLLQFSLCIGNVFDGRQDGMPEDDLQTVTESAVNASAFQFIANFVLGFKSQVIVTGKPIEFPFELPNSSLGITEQNTDGFETTVGKPTDTQLASTDLQNGVLELLELMLRDFIIKMMPLLRRIKHKEEDSLTSQTSHRQFHPHHPNSTARNDIEALFTVVSLVYKDRPEASLRYWPIGDDRLYGFLKWGSDCKNSARAFFDMIGSLAAGPQCAQHAYDFLKSNGGRYGTQSYSAPRTLCSWDRLFEAIEFYTNNLNQNLAAGSIIEKIRPEEEALLKSMLRLLRTVAQYSLPARCSMNDNKQYRVTHALFRFFICPISVDLKASILDAIAAFATPTGLGGDHASLVWDYLEQAKVLPKSYGIAPEQALAVDKSVVPHRQEHEQVDSGIGFDIQEIETANETYPETIAFTRLLSSLIQVPLIPEELLSGGSPTIPTLLGSSYRPPGVIPYTRFVLDVIFVKALQRPYRVANEKWAVVEACLSYMERCILSFDIGSYILGNNLKSAQDRTSIEAQTNQALKASLHPGFEVLTRLFSGGDVLREMFKVLGTGVTVLNKDDQTTPHLKTSILRCFKILTKAMQLQDIFFEYIVQVLLTTPSNKNAVLSSLAPIEQHLSFSHASIIDIALYINCDVSNEICSLTIEILDRISASPLFSNGVSHYGVVVNRLVRLLEASPMSKQIVYGFVAKLSADCEESTFEFGSTREDTSTVMAQDGTDTVLQKRVILPTPPITLSTIRLQIMRLLLDNLNESRTTHSIAHFLLGYPSDSKSIKKGSTEVLSDPSSVSVLTVVLELLRRGSNVQEYDQSSPSHQPLYLTHPQLAEKCQELIYRLCSDAYTTSSTMRHLRTQEAFFYRHLRALPIEFGPGLEGDHGTFTRLDGSRFRGNLFNLLSQLYQRSWVMKTSALELRVACDSKQRREAISLLNLLYTSTDNSRTASEDDYLYSLTRSKAGTLVQPRMKILELLDSIDFAWEDDLKVQDLNRYYFADVPEDSCLEKDEYGVELINARKLFSVLLARKVQLENDNQITGSGSKTSAHNELRAIMEQCLAHNHARRLEASRKNAFEAWRELVEISLGPGFELLKVEQRESILYDILEAVLAKIQQDNTAEVTTILTKVALCVLQSLRIDHFRQFIFQASSADPREIDARLPAERLHRIAREIIGCILRPGTPQSRCNLYSTLVNYFQFTRTDGDTHRSAIIHGQRQGASTVREALELGNQVMVADVGDRLFEIVCRDASGVDQVCKVAAFTLLNALYDLFEKETTNRVLIHLVQRNYLKHFIEILAREDQELQAAVRGRVSRIPIVSETRMTLFLRIAQHRDGAEQLLEYGFFDVLSNSSTVIDMRSNLNTTDYGLFEQTESNRYHNIVYPMLQVAVAILANLGRNHRTATSKAEQFVASHQDTIASILRDNDFPTTINSLRELRVVTALMHQLAGDNKTRSSSTAAVFSPLHSLAMALVPKYCSVDKWAQSLQPVSDAEKILCATMAPSLTAKAGTTLFERDARSLAKDICKNLLSYCQISTEVLNRTAAQSTTPAFTWTVSNVASGHHDSSAMPSLATLVTYLGRLTDETQEIIVRHQTQQQKLDTITSLTPDEKQNILEASDEPYIEDLVSVQRDQLAVQVLQKMLLTSSQEVSSSLYLLETCLVLLWRHLEYYLGQYAGMLDSSNDLKAGLGASRFGQSGVFGSVAQAGVSVLGASGVGQSQMSKNYNPTLVEAQSLKRDAGHVVRPILDVLAGLDLNFERTGLTNGSHGTFIQLLANRLRTLVERA
ncbi:hypothetical protein BGZ94_001527 [Podila epigama]|nr:hypothetical protein BGZ94_001527 [Podila epigama]